MLKLLLIIIYLSFISLGLPDSLLGSAWPAIQADLSVSLPCAGVISMVVSVGTILSSLMSGRLIQRYGTGKVTAFSVCMTAVALAGFGYAPSFIWLCLLAVPLGLGAGSVDTALDNFVALHYQARHMNWLYCFWGIGATAGPLIIGHWLSSSGQWRYGYRMIGVIQAGLAFILFASLPLWRCARSEQNRICECVDAGAAQKTQDADLKRVINISGVKTVLASFFCYCGLEATTGLWGSSYLVLGKGAPVDMAAGRISLFYMGISIGRLLSGFLSVRMEHKRMIRLGQAVSIAGVLLLLSPGNGMTAPAFLMAGIGFAPILPEMLHRTPQVFGEELSQKMMGIQMACAYTGTTLAPPLFGMIASHLSIRLFPCYLLAMAALMVAMTELTNRPAEKNSHGP